MEPHVFIWRNHQNPRYTSPMNFFFPRLLVIIAALTLCPIASPSQTDTEKVAPIQSERFAVDFHNKKIIDLMSLYTPDAEFIDANGARYKGVDEIRKHFEELFDVYDIDLHLKSDEFQQS